MKQWFCGLKDLTGSPGHWKTYVDNAINLKRST